LHGLLLSGVPTNGSLVVFRENERVRQDSNKKLPLVGLVNINGYGITAADSEGVVITGINASCPPVSSFDKTVGLLPPHHIRWRDASISGAF
jgi:hypothetical protein